jgi:hypothetical protein
VLCQGNFLSLCSVSRFGVDLSCALRILPSLMVRVLMSTGPLIPAHCPDFVLSNSLYVGMLRSMFRYVISFLACVLPPPSHGSGTVLSDDA